MPEDPRGRGPVDRPPIVDAEGLRTALELLGYTLPDGMTFSRARLLGMLRTWVELIALFDLDRVDVDEARMGTIHALVSGASWARGRTPFWTPVTQTSPGTNADANLLYGELIHHRLNSTLLDLEELAPKEDMELSFQPAVLSLMRALCSIVPFANRPGYTTTWAEVGKAAKAALKHLAAGRQTLHYVAKRTT
ncbi:hypothetical protein [Streptomyces sp. NRRL S-350]|uniref:hypothetical protein n=1 Tax=Streptomyces sp. NRRL S-350 TaxID=1463902 RepID=UPI0004BFB3CF|nr:hypothetical protein [Streptomyces sp. NRRL S-350]